MLMDRCTALSELFAWSRSIAGVLLVGTEPRQGHRPCCPDHGDAAGHSLLSSAGKKRSFMAPWSRLAVHLPLGALPLALQSTGRSRHQTPPADLPKLQRPTSALCAKPAAYISILQRET